MPLLLKTSQCNARTRCQCRHGETYRQRLPYLRRQEEAWPGLWKQEMRQESHQSHRLPGKHPLLMYRIAPDHAIQSCKGQFCPTHRMPDSHTCVTLTPASTPSKQAALSPAGIAAMKRAASSALSSKTNPTPTTSRQNPASSSAPKQNAKPVAGLIKEIKTDRCEPSPSPVLSEKPTIHNITGTPTNNVASVTINTAINNRSNRAPTDRPRNPIPDPTKKWVPAALFASA